MSNGYLVQPPGHRFTGTRMSDRPLPPSRFVDSVGHDFYVSTACKAEPMTREEEIEAFKAYRAGDMDARDRIMASNQRFVVLAAGKFFGSPLPVEDLVQEGNIGMLRALEKFNLNVGIRFLSYARWWIRQAMQEASMRKGWQVTMPARSWSYCTECLVWWSDYTDRTGRQPTIEEIVDGTGKSEPYARIAAIMRLRGIYMDLDVPGSDTESDLPWRDSAMFSTGPNQLSSMNKMDMARMAADAVALLGDRERTIIDLRFGLSSGEPMRLNEVGEEVGLSRERVRQILNESIEKLRSLVDMEEYKEVLS